MSADEATIHNMETSFQVRLFELPNIEKGGGALTLTQTKNIPLPHEQTATILKSPATGVGSVVGINGGTATIVGFSVRDGRITWTAQVDDLEVEL